jgi:hypothetical protein
MLENTVELVGDLCLIALPLLIILCTASSIVGALRAVSQGKRHFEYEEGVNHDGSRRAQELERVVQVRAGRKRSR